MKKNKIIKNKKKFIIIMVIIAVLGICAGLVIKMVLKTDDTPIYGNRLDGIEDYSISDENIDNLKNDIKALESVQSISYKLEGKLINIIITVDDTLSLDTFKEYGAKALEYFTDEQKSYYDIQIFGKSDNEESETYPVIGYKKNSLESLTW